MKDIYVDFKSGEIKGDSRDARHKDAVEVTSFRHMIRQPRSATSSSAGGHTAERVEFGDLSFTKEIDYATPALMVACASGTLLKDVEIHFYRAYGGNSAKGEQSRHEYYTLEAEERHRLVGRHHARRRGPAGRDLHPQARRDELVLRGAPHRRRQGQEDGEDVEPVHQPARAGVALGAAPSAPPSLFAAGRHAALRPLAARSPDRRRAGVARRAAAPGADARAARDTVARDVEALLNTRGGAGRRGLDACPNARRSTLAFGLEDFSSMSLASGADRVRICRAIERAIADHEPRLREVQVALGGRDPTLRRVVFSIRATLSVHPLHEPVSFEAMLLPSTRTYAVQHGAAAGMNDLLPHYERELAFLRERAGEFARRHPKIAGRLQLTGDVGADPHAERLIESFAFLSSRIHKRLDDDFPLFTESLLEVLYPHYLRPFPSCSIARFEPAAGAAQPAATLRIGRGTMLASQPVQGVACRFRTAFDVALAPLRLASAAFRGTIGAPEGTRLPRTATTLLSLRFELDFPRGELGRARRRRAAPLPRRRGVAGQRAARGAVRPRRRRLRAVGRGGAVAGLRRRCRSRRASRADEALIDFDARSHPAYRLLTEYFAFRREVRLRRRAAAGVLRARRPRAR